MLAISTKDRTRFRVHFDNFGGEDAEYLMAHVRRVQRPCFRAFDLMGMTDHEFTQVEIDMIDDADDRIRAAVIRQLQRQLTQEMVFSLVIETIDRAGTVREQWMLRGCRLAQVDFSVLASDTDELSIHLAIAPRHISTTVAGEILELVR